ncbi:MAG: HK97 family phage prohead protease [Lewinella sp.]|uniref:HK97 family phage prohead protease n=1 Tax=Lewinella sp. TaxID=2004506 RepID=UPI003D6A5DBE
MNDYIQKRDDKAERRYISPQIEIREEGDNRTIEGIAAVVNKETDLGWFTERIAPGAFDDVMGDDVVALFNHDPNFPLARTTANGEGSLELFLNENGDLGYRFQVPNTSIGRDLQENIRNGIISKSSFAFTISEEDWVYTDSNEVPDRREIKKVKRLYDVAPVTYPAYNDTSVAARSMAHAKQPEKDLAKDLASRDSTKRKLNLK